MKSHSPTKLNHVAKTWMDLPEEPSSRCRTIYLIVVSIQPRSPQIHFLEGLRFSWHLWPALSSESQWALCSCDDEEEKEVRRRRSGVPSEAELPYQRSQSSLTIGAGTKQSPNTPTTTPPHLPYQGNLDSWAPALTFCYIYSLREIISLMNSSPGLLELNEDIKMWKNGTKSSEYSLVPQPDGEPVYSEYNPSPPSFCHWKSLFARPSSTLRKMREPLDQGAGWQKLAAFRRG